MASRYRKDPKTGVSLSSKSRVKKEDEQSEFKQTIQPQSRFSVTQPGTNQPLVGFRAPQTAEASSQKVQSIGETIEAVRAGNVQGAPLARFGRDIAQGTARSVASAGLTVINPLIKKAGQQPINISSPEQTAEGLPRKIQKVVFGEGSLKDLPTRTDEASSTLQKYGLGKGIANPLAFAGVAGMTALDLTGFGGAEKNVVKALAKEADETIIRGILKKIGVAEDLIPSYATKFAKTSDAKVIEQGLESIKKIQGATKAGTKNAGKPVIIDPDLYKKKYNDFNPVNHEKYSAMAKAEYAKQLKENPSPVVKFTAGGSGSGKSDFILPRISRGHDGIILDGTLANYDSAVRKIKQAEAAGKKVEVHGALTRIDTAWNFVQKRAKETGRHIPLSEFIKMHRGALDTLERLVKEQPGIKITLKDIRYATTKAEGMEAPLVAQGEEILKRIQVAKKEMEKAIPSLAEGAGKVQKATQLQQISKVTPDLKPTTSTLKGASQNTLSRIPEGRLSQPPIRESSLKPLISDAKTLQTNVGVNVDNLKISDEAKSLINQTVDEVKPLIESKIGTRLSNQQVLKEAESSSRVLRRAISKEETLNWEAAMLRTRQQLAKAAETGKVNQEFIENLLTVKTMGTDIARKLQSLSIKAEEATSMQMVLEAVVRQTDNVTEVYNAARGVDFNDFKQASEFYRKFVKPTAGEWIDALRYNSMLSSPNTHIINTFSNAINSTVFAPLEKAIAGGLDFLGSTITGAGRKHFAGEAGAYLKGYFSNIKEATRRFSDVMAGRRMIAHLDVRNIPLATGGLKGKAASVLNFPMRLLEASDQFFTALTAGGEGAALGLKASKGVKVGNIAIKAEQKAAYRLFRQELFPEGQGVILDAIDQFTNMVSSLRNNKNPIVSTVAKFTVPFLRTPMNIFKQGIEYSPLGFTTLVKNTDKTTQMAKAMIGSSIFAGAGLMVASDRLTFEEPASATQRDAWRAAGRQPYSIKIGDKWYSYQKLPPPLAYPIAMVAAISDVQKNKGADDDWADAVLSGVAKYGSFLADQSYAKSFGDLLDAVQGAESSISKLISNYPQQVIPFRALGGWFARLFDESQRKVDNKAGFIDKQMQQLMLNIPFLSQKVPARTDAEGNPLKADNRVLNAFSPVRVKQASEQLETFLKSHEERLKLDRDLDDAKTKLKENIRPVYDRAQELKAEGKEAEAQQLIDNLSDEDYEIYKSIRTSEKTKATNRLKDEVFPIFKRAQELKAEGKMEDAQALVDELSDEEYKVYLSLKKAYTEE